MIKPHAVMELGNSSETIGLRPLEAGAESWPGDLVVMTSGSTGQPKGVVVDLARYVANAALAMQAVDLRGCNAWAIETDPALASAMGHFLMAWLADIPLIYTTGLQADQKRAVFGRGQVGFGGAPLQLLQLSEVLDAATSPAVMVSSGDFLPASSIARIRERLPQCRLVKMYGLTEVGGRFCVAPDALLREQPDAAGRPLPGFLTAILSLDENRAVNDEAGEVAVLTPLLFLGYCRIGRGFIANEPGYFRTGDLGVLGKDGVITLSGRRDDVFKVSGEKVDRITIERLLQKLLTPAEFCVLPLPHPVLGSLPALFVGRNAPEPLPSWADIVAYVTNELPSRYVPALMFHLPDGLPKLDNGKLDKQRMIVNHKTFTRIR